MGRAGSGPAEFLAYVKDETKITFPWSMIDKITPRPDAKVQKMLADDGFEDNYTIVTEKHTFTAPFVNAEETQYLCIEDHYTNGRPPLELGGVLYCDRETVDKIEKMKVCTCLNPLHTAMSIYGCMLGYTLISAEMADEDLRSFIQKIGYIEAMPVVVDPGVLNPYEFIGAVINRRLPNPFMPDAPQRIATDTSQKLAIRFGETIKAYEERGLDKSNLILIPLVLAGYARYLTGLDDNCQPFEISTDPLLAELQAIVAPLKVEAGEQDFSCLKALYSRTDVFGVDLYAVGLGEKIESMAKGLFRGPAAPPAPPPRRPRPPGAQRPPLPHHPPPPPAAFCFAAAWVFIMSFSGTGKAAGPCGPTAFLMIGGSKMIVDYLIQFRMVCSVSTSNRWTLWGSKATRTVSPLRALEVGATRAVILLPLYSRYR